MILRRRATVIFSFGWRVLRRIILYPAESTLGKKYPGGGKFFAEKFFAEVIF
jgi:hypothetical protein